MREETFSTCGPYSPSPLAMTSSCNPLLRGASNRAHTGGVNESPVCEISASSQRERASRQKSPMRARGRPGNARKGKSVGERGRGGARAREKPGRDGDGRARKHLQRIGLARVFNPARGFLVGEIKRGQVKRDAEKIARARSRSRATHFDARVRDTLF